MSTNDNDKAWKNRVLCSDESCIGVVGPDGRCKECGLPFEGELPSDFNQDGSDDTAGDVNNNAVASEQSSSTEPEADESPENEASTTDDEWSKRTLCSDESCIGVIGPDGRCNECGKPHEDKH